MKSVTWFYRHLLFISHTGVETVTHLYSIMAEEKSGVSAHAHLEAGGTTPNRRFPNQQGERATLIAPIARAEDV